MGKNTMLSKPYSRWVGFWASIGRLQVDIIHTNGKVRLKTGIKFEGGRKK